MLTVLGTRARVGRRWLRWIAIAIAAAVVALPTLWIGWPARHRLEASPASRARIAILPVRNATGEPRYDWVRLGLAAATVDFLQQTQVGSVPPSDVVRLLEALELDGALDEAAQAEAARALWQAHGATHTLVPVLEAGTGNLRLSYRLLDREGRVRRRILVAPDAAQLARSLGADLSVQFGGERAQREAIDDGFVSEAYLRARALAMTGDYETAMPLLEAAIGLAPEAFWPRYEYALILRNRREFDLAEPLLRTLVDEAHAREDAVAEEYALNSLAILRWQREDLDEAEALYARALALAEARGDQPAIGKILQNASVISRIRRDLARSREQLLAALAAYTRAGFENPPPPLFMALGNQAEQEGDFVGAEQHYLRSEAGYRALGGGNAVAAAIYNRARLQFQFGRFETAGPLLDDAVTQYREHQDLRGLVGALNARAELELLRERPSEAETFARQAVEQADALPHDIPRAYTRKTLGRCLAAAGRIGDADEVFGHAQAYYRTGRLEEGWQETELLRAGLRLAQGDWRGARQRAEAVRAQAAEAGLERPQAEAESLLAQAAHRAGDREAMRAQWSAALQRLEQALPGEALRLAEHRLLAAQDWLDVGDAAEAGRLLELAKPILGTTPRWQAAQARLQTADRGRQAHAPAWAG